MLIGALGAIGQTSLKRLMAYSTISNMGYALMAVSLYSVSGNNVAYIYLLIYAIGTVGLFASLVALFGDESDSATFEDLKGAAYHRKALSGSISVIAFSMIGLPPFAGFFGKYYVFLSALQSNELLLVIIGVISSVISAFYYLKIVKHLYFFKPLKPFKKITTKKGLWLVTTISVTFTIFFFAFAYKYIV
jgi:NADH-quinone oxidoreductase subunit N